MTTLQPLADCTPEVHGGRRCWHLDLDGAWRRDLLGEGSAVVDALEWGPRLRYSATAEEMARFEAFAWPHRAPFTLFGSGDFHHLAALWLRQFDQPYTLISFDNHPDWDIRPPRWGCGTWVSRALEWPLLKRAVIWGCGNFELDRPHSFFANYHGLRSGRLQARPWAERLKPATRRRWPVITRETWQAEFSQFAESLAGERVYITVDLDCLRADESVTNWENGLFTAAEIAWALSAVRASGAEVIGGDVCGAWSPESYARFRQRIEARIDHPKLVVPDAREAAAINERAWRTIWPVLTGQA